MVSDDTILNLAVAECLIKYKNEKPSPKLYCQLVDYYKKGMRDMASKY